jgi:chitodextrinase
MTTIATASSLAWRTMVLALLATGALAAPSADRKPPTRPTNLRVTGVTAYSVSLAWTPSTDNVGVVRYVVCCSASGRSQDIPAPASSGAFTAGVEPNRTQTVRIYAVDAANNFSQPSGFVTATTSADTVPPTTPLVSVLGVGPTHVALTWSATDNGPNLWYHVRMNGTQLPLTKNTTQIFPLLTPEATYTFTVQARDFVNNLSAPSTPVAATTPPPNPDDVTPPTTPTLGTGYISGCEVQLIWTESTDDFDPQFAIEYEIYLNGEHVDSTALRFTRTIVYANQNGVNTFAVAAVDSAGNRSLLSNEFSDTFEGCVF